MSAPKIDKNLAREQLWRRGHLSFMLDANQKSLYEMFYKNPAKIQTWLLARRSGKSYTLCVLAIEHCLKYPNSVIKYVAPEKEQVERYILPIINTDILAKQGCPQDLKPRYISNKKEYVVWILNAKQAETREKRVKTAIEKLEKQLKNPSAK